MFLWLVIKNRLLMNAESCRRHLCQDASCNAYGAPVEDILHALQDFPRAISF